MRWKYGKRCNVYLLYEESKAIYPLLEKNNMNLSKTIRECVDFSLFALDKIGSIERSKEILTSNCTNDLAIGDKIILRVEKVIRL